MERKIFVLWLTASANMDKAKGDDHKYYLGQTVALVDAYAAVRDLTFIQANRELMNLAIEESRK